MEGEICVMGIDPGTVSMGYGIVRDRDGRTTALQFGALTQQASTPLGLRLRNLYLGLVQIVDRYMPDVVALEEPFVGNNVKVALALGRAQAIAILAAANQGISIFQYSPATVKQAVTNYGASSKEQVQEMVKILLNLPQVPQPSDAADALAVALCHLQQSRLARFMSQKKTS